MALGPTNKNRKIIFVGFNKMATNETKWQISLLSAFMFFVFTSPSAYQLTNSLFSNVLNEKGCPTLWGIAIQSFFYMLAVRAMM